MDDVDEIALLEGSTGTPNVQILISEYVGGKDPLKVINLDQAIIFGATIHSVTLSGEHGGEMFGGVMTKLIKC